MGQEWGGYWGCGAGMGGMGVVGQDRGKWGAPGGLWGNSPPPPPTPPSLHTSPLPPPTAQGSSAPASSQAPPPTSAPPTSAQAPPSSSAPPTAATSPPGGAPGGPGGGGASEEPPLAQLLGGLLGAGPAPAVAVAVPGVVPPFLQGVADFLQVGRGAWPGAVGGAWEWEGLFEWLGMWGRGMELWAGPGSGRSFMNGWEFGGVAWSCERGVGGAFLNGWEFGGVAWSCGRGLGVGGAL